MHNDEKMPGAQVPKAKAGKTSPKARDGEARLGQHDDEVPLARNDEALLRLRNVHLHLQSRLVLDAINLTVARREIVTLVGPNGGGKTTLVRIALGLLQPTHGQVKCKAARIGYVPQHFTLESTLPITVTRFIALGAHVRQAGASRALCTAGLGHLCDVPFQQLSGGEARRVLLISALLRGPQLLVLDEPDTGLDIVAQRELYQQIAAIRDDLACGVLLVSHDLHLVMAATDRVVCLNRHICCSGTPQAISQHPEYLKLLGSDSDALALYAHRHDHKHDLAGHVRA